MACPNHLWHGQLLGVDPLARLASVSQVAELDELTDMLADGATTDVQHRCDVALTERPVLARAQVREQDDKTRSAAPDRRRSRDAHSRRTPISGEPHSG